MCCRSYWEWNRTSTVLSQGNLPRQIFKGSLTKFSFIIHCRTEIIHHEWMPQKRENSVHSQIISHITNYLIFKDDNNKTPNRTWYQEYVSFQDLYSWIYLCKNKWVLESYRVISNLMVVMHSHNSSSFNAGGDVINRAP